MSSVVEDTKAIGEIPSGIILGVTENLTVADGIFVLIVLPILGIGMYYLNKGKKRMK
ncbi:hypothetical protein GQ472_01975 [archaeon]|nr:hypothetical protein [archaeon]